MVMKRPIILVLLVFLLGLLTIPSYASSIPPATSTVEPEGAPSQAAPAVVAQIEQLLAAAPVVAEGAKRERFVTIVTDPSGKRYAVIDFRFRPAEVTTALPIIEWQKRFGLESVRVLFPPEEPEMPVDKPMPEAEPTAACNGYPDCLVWFNPHWTVSHFRDELDQLDQFRPAGTRVFCRNQTPWTGSCTADVGWATTAGLNAKVTIDKLWEIGLQVAQSYSHRLQQTSPQVPSGWRVYFQPEVNFDLRFWTESRRRFWCGTYVGFPFCMGQVQSRWETSPADGEIFIARGLTMWGVPD